MKWIDALQKYHQANGILPAKIIVYRDGVNDFQLLDVIDSELPALNELCMKVQEGYEWVLFYREWIDCFYVFFVSPKLGMIIVKKRGSARFFARDGRQLINPSPGTIIDHTITNQGIVEKFS